MFDDPWPYVARDVAIETWARILRHLTGLQELTIAHHIIPTKITDLMDTNGYSKRRSRSLDSALGSLINLRVINYSGSLFPNRPRILMGTPHYPKGHAIENCSVAMNVAWGAFQPTIEPEFHDEWINHKLYHSPENGFPHSSTLPRSSMLSIYMISDLKFMCWDTFVEKTYIINSTYTSSTISSDLPLDSYCARYIPTASMTGAKPQSHWLVRCTRLFDSPSKPKDDLNPTSGSAPFALGACLDSLHTFLNCMPNVQHVSLAAPTTAETIDQIPPTTLGVSMQSDHPDVEGRLMAAIARLVVRCKLEVLSISLIPPLDASEELLAEFENFTQLLRHVGNPSGRLEVTVGKWRCEWRRDGERKQELGCPTTIEDVDAWLDAELEEARKMRQKEKMTEEERMMELPFSLFVHQWTERLAERITELVRDWINSQQPLTQT